MKARFTFLCILLFCACPLFSQEHWTIYDTTNSGLSANEVIGIEYAGINYVWAATYGNHTLDLFTGANWHNEVNDEIQSTHQGNLAVDLEGNLWIGGEGINKYGNFWTNYNIVNSGLPDNFIYSIAVDQDNNKWIGTATGGLVKFDGENWIIYDENNSPLFNSKIYCLAVNESGNIWIGTNNDGVYKFDGANWLHYYSGNSDLPDDAVYTIAIDPQGQLWCGTEFGVAVFNGSQWTIYNEANSELPDNYIGCFAFSPSGTTWIGTRGGGLVRIIEDDWTIFNTANSELPNNIVWDIAIESNEDKVWIATNGGGIALLNLTTAVAETTSTTVIQIFPNPASELIYLTSDYSFDSQISLTIYDAAGKSISSLKNINPRDPIDITTLAQGHYSLRIESGNNISIGKFIVD